MQQKVLVLFLSFFIYKGSLVKLKTDFKLNTQINQSKNQAYISVALHTGQGKENKNELLNFVLDFQEQNILVANKKFYDWGLICDDYTKNSCNIKSMQEKEDHYKTSNYSYNDGSLFLRFYSQEQIIQKSCDINLINRLQKENWPVQKNNILGLSPNSIFATYLRQNFEHSVQFLLMNYINTNNYKESIINQQMYLNPVIDFKLKKYYKKYNDNEKWHLTSNIQYSESQVVDQQNYCLTLDQNLLFFAPSTIVNKISNLILSNICEDINNCTQENANLQKAEILTIQFDEMKLQFDYTKYLILDIHNRFQVKIANIENLHDQNRCKEYEYALGNNVFDKVSISFTFIKQGGVSIALLDNTQYIVMSDDKNLKIILIIIAIFFVLTLIGFYLIGRQEKQKTTYEPQDIIINEKEERLI